MKLTINPEYAEFVPPLSESQYQSLKESIQENGLWMPIIVNSEGVILDGHHRFKICNKLGVQIKHAIREFESKNDEIIFVGESNLKRRNMIRFVRIELSLKLKPHYEIRARKNSLANLKQYQNKIIEKIPEDSTDPPTLADRGDTRDQISNVSEVGHGTVDKVEYLLEHATPDQLSKLRKEEGKIHTYYKEYNMKEKNLIVRDIPKGQFDLIYIDPPWESKSGQTRGTPEQHYNTMDDNSIIDMNLPMADDCIVFLWTIASMQKQAFECLESWGLKYKTQMIWDKESIGVGYWTRTQHEILFIATKGNVGAPAPSLVKSSVYREKKTKHSAKPEYFRKLIESYYPVRKKLEMFARTKREGWEAWGNDLE